MYPWSLLGLPADADLSALKRRYAQLLRQARPDDDPEAFQRLREAYEQALDRLRAADAPSLPATAVRHAGEPCSRQPDPVAPHEAAGQEVAQLLERCASLDDALQQARESGLERALQLHLLARCEAVDEHGQAVLGWAMQRLHWLSPWQADYLPQAPLERLAERLLAQRLEALDARLRAGEERAVLEAVGELASSDWLRPLERRQRLHEGVLRLLEHTPQWSPALFERLGACLGWDERQGVLPCAIERWDALCRRCEGQALKQRLLDDLAQVWPLNAEQRAAWLLLKPLDSTDRRHLVDRFGDDDWLACEALDDRLRLRHPELPEQLGATAWAHWQRWRPRRWAAPAAVYAWTLLFAALLLDGLYGTARQPSSSLFGLLLENLVASLFAVALLASLARGWSWLTHYWIRLDLPLSRLLLPAAWAAGGAGMLVMRHGVPAAAFAALVALFSPWPHAWPVFFAVLALALLFLGLVGSGRSPWPRLSVFDGGSWKVDYSRKAEW